MAGVNFELTVSEKAKAARTITRESEDFLLTAGSALECAEHLAELWEGPSHEAFARELQTAWQRYQQITDTINTYVAQLNYACVQYLYGPSDDEAESVVKSK